LLRSSDAFWKFSACKFKRKSSGRNSTICGYKNKAVYREIQTHSGSSLPASLKEKVVGAISSSKNEAVGPEIQAHFGSSLPASLTESSGRNSTICASKNETVCCEIQTHFASAPPPGFAG